MHEALQVTHQARVAVVAMFTAAAEEGWTVRQAVEASRAYLAHKGLPHVPDPIAFATNGGKPSVTRTWTRWWQLNLAAKFSIDRNI